MISSHTPFEQIYLTEQGLRDRALQRAAAWRQAPPVRQAASEPPSGSAPATFVPRCRRRGVARPLLGSRLPKTSRARTPREGQA